MAKAFLFSFLLVGLFHSAQGLKEVVNKSYNTPPNADNKEVPMVDCTNAQETVIVQAYNDALSLASDAKGVLRNGGRATRFTSFFTKLFVTENSIKPVGDSFSGIASESTIPSEVIFHCNPAWLQGFINRQTLRGIATMVTPCSTRSEAKTLIVTSGTFKSTSGNIHPDYGSPHGAYRKGTHIMLCPRFFTTSTLANIKTAVATSHIDRRTNQGMIMLHELFHAASQTVIDGGYEYAGCVATAQGNPPKDKGATPLENADSYALYSMACTATGNMNQFDWTTGVAVTP